MKSIVNTQFLLALEKYVSDCMFRSAMRDVHENFFKEVPIQLVVSEVVHSLLVAQAMENMLAGYGGRSVLDTKYLREAIGYHLGNPQLDYKTPERYVTLIDTVQKVYPQ